MKSILNSFSMLNTAFQFMKYDMSKLLGVLLGIIISAFLIGAQLGIFNTMLNSMKGLAEIHKPYIWVINKNTQTSMTFQNLDVRVGRSLYSIDGVKKVYPIILGNGTGKFPRGGKFTLTLIGLQSPEFVGGAKQYYTSLNELFNEGAVFVNKVDLPVMDNIKEGEYFTINEQRVYLGGLFTGLSGFGNSYVITTAERVRKLCNIDNNYVSAYLVEIDSSKNYTSGQVINNIESNIPGIKAKTGDKFGAETLIWFISNSNIAVSFGLMVIFAIVAGFAIVGLTMFSAVNDRIRDYGTIKAIGGDNNLIAKIIYSQAFIYAVIGFIISFMLLLVYKYAMSGGMMEVKFPAWLIIFLIVITICISFIGSLFAFRKIKKLEPVQIFRM